VNLQEFDFAVPVDLVAQRPLEHRDASRMLVYHRGSGKVEHRRFLDLPEYLTRADTVVFNQSRVLKARLVGTRETGGKVEVFLLRRLAHDKFDCLVKATAAAKVGLRIRVGDALTATILRETATAMIYEVELQADDGRVDFWIDQVGQVPLPPYIRRAADGLDISRYQTVFASEPGSVAAPTAGLHFNEAMLERIEALGTAIRKVTLHVGLGTFQPIKVENLEEHRMHRESFLVPDDLKRECVGARARGRRVVAVGTTSVRALESAARGFESETELFLRPGQPFLWVDAIFTNFHQPKSSLAVMMAAFVGGPERLRDIYAQAVAERYRFFSYGDCMLVI
jgi:S-adenosylmethionine:tRNA ribosyltransferase-isomerase